ncbi:hypothetical protein V8J36_22590 [Frigidibacter sp. MR17.14]|uniref:hypothetical protein n=1 Tax=Frigidibacter sp. MR17.14 TaxID=3126509 RepID=UPI003012E54F
MSFSSASTASRYRIVMRMAGLFPQLLGRYESHRLRVQKEREHCNPTPERPNRLLIGEPDWAIALRQRVEKMRRRNLAAEVNALHARRHSTEAHLREADGPKDPWRASKDGPLREIILTAHHEWFDDAEDAAVEAAIRDAPNLDRLDLHVLRRQAIAAREDAFITRATTWLQDTFGAACVHARVDHDESACHIHAVVMVTTEKTSVRRGRQEMIQPSAHAFIKSYEAGQDSVGEAFAELGLERGEPRAAARREMIAEEDAVSAAEGRAFDVTKIPPKRGYVKPAKWRAEEKRALAKMRKLAAEEAADVLAAAQSDRVLAAKSRATVDAEIAAARAERSDAAADRAKARSSASDAEADRLVAAKERSAATEKLAFAKRTYGAMRAAEQLLGDGERFGWQVPDPEQMPKDAPKGDRQTVAALGASRVALRVLTDVWSAIRRKQDQLAKHRKQIAQERAELERERSTLRDAAAAFAEWRRDTAEELREWLKPIFSRIGQARGAEVEKKLDRALNPRRADEDRS